VLKTKNWASFQRIIELLPKNLSLSSQKYGFGIRDPEKTYSGSRILNQGSKRHRIPDPETQHWFSNIFSPCRVKAKVVELYGLKSLEFEAVFGGPEPQFGESQRKQAAAPLNRAKKGQFTLDSWIKVPCRNTTLFVTDGSVQLRRQNG
jgi:hypothetical protein